ncbi:unnamed protein product, partial [Ectocarpus sp. 12 AP-2014]
NQPGRQEGRGGLRDAFHEGTGAASVSPRESFGDGGGGGGGSPRLSTGSRGGTGGSNSPRLLAPLLTRSGTPPDCKAPASPRRSAPASPRRSQIVLDPLEPKSPGSGG